MTVTCDFFDPFGQRRPFDELHDDGARGGRPFEAINRGDVRMIQRSEHFGFALEACEAVGILDATDSGRTFRATARFRLVSVAL